MTSRVVPASMSVSIATLNVRGLTDQTKRTTLFRFLRQQRYDVIALQETFCADAGEAQWWSQQWSDKPSRSFWTVFRTSDGHRARGVAILFGRRFTGVVTDVHTSDDGRQIRLSISCNSYSLRLYNIYASTNARERSEFFRQLQQTILSDQQVTQDLPIVVCGDFNCITDPSLDRIGGQAGNGTGGAAALRQLMTLLPLIDAWRDQHPDEKGYTWRSADGLIASRLDRILVSEVLAAGISGARILRAPLPALDHSVVEVHIRFLEVQRGPGYWKLNCNFLSEDAYRAKIKWIISDAIRDLPRFPTVASGWEALKSRVRAVSIAYGQDRSKRLLSRRRALESEYSTVESLWRANPAAYAARFNAAKDALEADDQRYYEAAAVRSRVKWAEEGERPTAFFCRLEKTRAAAATLTSVIAPSGTEVSQPHQMTAAAADHFKALYTKEDTDPEACDYLLRSVTAKLSDDAHAAMDEELSLTELTSALQQAAKGKTPGIDGLPYEFYRVFWDQLGPVLLRVFQECLALGTLPLTMRTGVFSLLYKKGDRRLLHNWRPISLLCTDTKLLSLALNRRLMTYIDQIISADQAGFMPGRVPGENILLVQSALRYHRSGYVLLLDQQNAFDRVDRDFMMTALERFGCPPRWCAMVRLLYANTCAQVLVNGWLSNPFALTRGVRQGDPLSPVLYNLVDEVLASALRADNLFKGLSSPDRGTRPFKVAQFADDKAVGLQDGSDADRLMHWLDLYRKATNGLINWSKTVGFVLCPGTDPPMVLSTVRWIPSDLTARYLGVEVGLKPSAVQIWQGVVDKSLGTLRAWQGRALSLRGRVVVIRTLAASRLWYLASTVVCPPDILKRLTTALWTFLWRGRPHGKISRAACLLPTSYGGLGVIDVDTTIKALHLNWLRRLFDATPSLWKAYLLNDLQSSTLSTVWGLGLDILGSALRPSDVLSTHLPPFLRETVRSWLTVGGRSSTSPTTREEVLREPLFFNRHLPDVGCTSLSDRTWKPIAAQGITHVRHIWDSARQCFARSCALKIPDAALTTLRQAIPQDWKRLLESPVLPQAGDWFAYPKATQCLSLAAQVVGFGSNGTVRVAIYRIRTDLRVLSRPNGLIDEVIDHTWRRLAVDPAPTGWTCAGFADSLPLKPENLVWASAKPDGSTEDHALRLLTTKRIRQLLLQKRVPHQPLVTRAWQEAVGGTPISWMRVWKWAWNANFRPLKACDTLWQLLHNVLPTGHLTRHWNDNPTCPACRNAIETSRHLFIDCPVAHELWSWALDYWRRYSGASWSVSIRVVIFGALGMRPKLPLLHRKVWFALHGNLIHCLWLQRCRAVFDSQSLTVPSLRGLLVNALARQAEWDRELAAALPILALQA